jgi:hypothetical protein
MKNLEEMISQLPPELRDEVEAFVRKLLNSGKTGTSIPPSFSWAGALRDMQGKYTSVELQHEISKRRPEPRA